MANNDNVPQVETDEDEAYYRELRAQYRTYSEEDAEASVRAKVRKEMLDGKLGSQHQKVLQKRQA